MSVNSPFDVFIIGGGINGAAIAHYATLLGLRVGLCDAQDFGAGTSAASSKMIHGGLRYLEHGALGHVRQSLKAQHQLMQMAPHLVRPLQIYSPDEPRLRSPWRVRCALTLYDLLGARKKLPHFHRILFPSDATVNPLNLSYKRGFAFYDCITQDTRLVLEHLLAAQEQSAVLLPHHRCSKVSRQENRWSVELTGDQGNQVAIDTRVLINATGPWTNQFNEESLKVHSSYRARLIKGSHLVFPRLYTGDQAYLLQNIDGRIIFVAPFQTHFTMVGTTEIPFEGSPGEASIEPDEIYYLCDAINRCFHHRLQPRDIVGSFSGVRPLLDDNRPEMGSVTREAKVELLNQANMAPLVNIYGGKLTTHWPLAMEVGKRLCELFPSAKLPADALTVLPGGQIEQADCMDFSTAMQEAYPWLNDALCERYVFTYGQRMVGLLGDAQCIEDLGASLGHGLYEREVLFLREHEWATTVDDILWRRTQLGYYFSKGDMAKLKAWWSEQRF